MNIELEADYIVAELKDKDRVFAYYKNDQVQVRPRLYCNGSAEGLGDYVGTYDKKMTDMEIFDKLKHQIGLINQENS